MMSVIEQCALTTDLDLLPHGDTDRNWGAGDQLVWGPATCASTLARVVYFDADIVFLDDPLSAVDAHVGRTIFEDCICLWDCC